MEERIIEVISKSLGEQALTKEEEQALVNWLSDNGNKNFYQDLKQFSADTRHIVGSKYADVDRAYEKHLDKLKDMRVRKRSIIIKKLLPYAAAVFLMFGVGTLMFQLGSHSNRYQNEWQADIKPGSNKAELIMADGKVLDLEEDVKKNEIQEKDGTRISNTGKRLIYDASTKSSELLSYNSLVVPRGGEFQLTLEDGTRVTLNSESSLRYPTRFSANKREVLLEGEAYFEVSKDKNRPFIVKTKSVDIKVLGTHFNVSSYTDERTVQTTLVEGSVSVIDRDNNGRNILLQPGQQAVYAKNSRELIKRDVNVDLYTSWKDGRFVFQESSLSEIMRKVSRWYDVKVFFQDQKSGSINFTGSLKRYENLERLLGMIEKTHEVKFIRNKNVIVVQKME